MGKSMEIRRINFHYNCKDEEKSFQKKYNLALSILIPILQGLLTKLSIETTQINTLVLSIFVSFITTIGAIIIGLIIGFIHDWKISLIVFAFIPFISGATILMDDFRENDRNLIKKRIEAGSVLSKCYINSKNCFKYYKMKR